MSKRVSGEGTVFKYRTGWAGQWTEVVDGKRVRRTVYGKTQDEVADKIRDATDRVREGLPGTDSSSPFREVAERWRVTAQVSQGVSARSMGTYVGVLNLHVYPVIGHLPIKDVKPSHVADVLQRMANKGLSRSYQHQAHKAISNVMKMAMADELIIRNATTAVKAPRGGHKPKVVPTREQVALMMEHAPDDRMRAFVAVLAYSGLRIQEALSLRWSDWNPATATLVVRNGKGGKPRAIPVPAALDAELRRWRKSQTAERLAAAWWDTDADWILSSEVGTQWEPHNARKRFRPLAGGRKALPAAGPRPATPAIPAICPGATPHSLRHATATILLEQGVPMRVVSELLGHSSTRITEDVYSHVTARLLTEAAAALDGAFGG